ncbi:MAG TPA: M42 family metallopeptidase [Solirubrobacteraceae bacterium]|nr:M42 family metallopeptidase [Solirubrobacteraceae bacterium]
MPVPTLLQRLLTAPAPSGYESGAAEVWREGCAEFAEVNGDKVGSSSARVRARPPGGGPTLAVVGHIDEIGLHVTHIDDDGYLHFGTIGGWDAMLLVAQRVRLATRAGPVIGVIGRKPIHLMKDEDRKSVPEVKDLVIDIGAKDGEEARSLARIGDFAVIDVEPVELPNERLVSRSLDNRVGCYVAAEAARLVAQEGGARGDVVALAVAQEEISFAGARTSAYALRPDLAIVVDVTFATDQPGIEIGQINKHGLGSGPVIAYGSILHPRISDLLHDAAEEAKIDFSLESLGRGTGTDADAIHITREGIPTGLVSVPLRYMHSPVETVSLADVDAAARLIAGFARRLEPGMSFER